MSFIPFEYKGKTVTKKMFDASCLAVTSYAENAELIGKALAIQCLVEGNAKPVNEFFIHASFKKQDGKFTVRAMRLARYIESLTYGYMRIGREGNFTIVACKKEKSERRGFYMLGDKSDDIPTWPVVLHNGRPKPEEVASLVVNVHSFTEFEEFQPVREKLSTEVSVLSEAAALRKFRGAHKALHGMTLEGVSPESYAEMVKICDELLGVVVNSQGKPNLGIDAEAVKLDGNNSTNIVNTSPRSRVALEAEVKNLSEQVRILQALDTEALRKQRDLAQVEAERLSKEVELKNLILQWQAEVIRCMQAGESATQALAMLKTYEDKLRYKSGDDSIPMVEYNGESEVAVCNPLNEDTATGTTTAAPVEGSNVGA